MSVLVAHTLTSACRVHSVLLCVQWCLCTVQELWCEPLPRAFGGDPVEPGSQVNNGPAFVNEWGNSEDGAKKHGAFPSDT